MDQIRTTRFERLESRLVSTVGIGLLVFSVIAGLFTYSQAYRDELEQAGSLQRQLVRVVQIQAEVAAFAANEQIARGVLSGLVANPAILGARIESSERFELDLGYRENAGLGTSSTYDLFSPIDHKEVIGTLTVVQDDQRVRSNAVRIAMFHAGLMLLQLLIAVAAMAIALRAVMIRPITRLAQSMAAIVPGSSAQIDTDRDHANDEIGLLTRSVNALLEASEEAIYRERRLRQWLESTGHMARIGGWTLDVTSMALGWTRETYRLHELDMAEPIDLERAIGFYAPAAGESIRTAVQQCIETGAPFDLELPMARASGSQIWMRTQGQAEQMEGRTVRLIGTIQDITERKNTEAKLLAAMTAVESASRTKSRFLAAASHDLRQPIQAIKLFAEALTRTELNAEQKRLGAYLAASATSLGDLLNALLEISRLDANVITAVPEAIAAEALAARIDAEFSPLAAAKGLRFKLAFPFRDMVLMTDGGLLMSLLGNLIGNAVKYTSQGGVLVAIRRRGDQALIQVWDTGIGIDAKHLETIYDEYFQLGNPERDIEKGLGLGLSIVKRLARLLETDVVCRSQPGRGSIFEFRLPLAGHPDAEAR
jgi:PAS domain S-box-containing protein